MMTAPAVSFENVTKSFRGQTAVDGVTLSVAPGESLALLGHNGAGKTTLIKLALGLTRADSGVIALHGVAPRRGLSAADKRAIGFLPENVVFGGSLTGREMLRFYGKLKGVGRAACDNALERVGLAEAARRRVKTYSKGMRQRLGLAQAVLGAPKILFLDEPTSGLDPGFRRVFYDTLRELAAHGTTILLSSHALTEVEARTERIAIMRAGRLVACGTLDALRRQAGLSTSIRVTVKAGEGAQIAAAVGERALMRINDHAVEFSCAPDEKLALVGRIIASGDAVEDIEIVPPGLDALYDHFRGEGPAS